MSYMLNIHRYKKHNILPFTLKVFHKGFLAHSLEIG